MTREGPVMKPYYQDDWTTIYHGDCLEVLPELNPVDCIISDPPYMRDVYLRMRAPDSKHWNGTIKRLKDTSSLVQMANGDIGAMDEEVMGAVAMEADRLVRRWAIFFSCAESIHLWRKALVAAGLRYVRTGAWVKPNAMPQMRGDRPGVGFEPCTIAHAPGLMKWNGGGHLAVWVHGVSRGDERPEHPCPKPLSLMKELVRLFSDPGECILDPFLGSGTTLRAAKDAGRKAIGIEIEERYCEIAARQLSQEVLQF